MKMKLLLHTCCSCCAVYVVELLKKDYDVVLFFSNSNIFPREEYNNRLDSTKKLAENSGVALLIDEYNLLRDSAFVSDEVRDMNMQLLIIDKFEMDVEGAKLPDSIEDRDNIMKGYKQLPSTDRKLIDKSYEQNFGKFGVDINTRVRCQKCAHEEDVSIDLVRQFFRSIYQ